MKRLLIAAAILCAFVSSSLLADENVRALQGKLKAGGFYFGEINGTYESQTAAAVTRYQIRNGLPITGQLDPETAKALGVTAVKPSTPPQTSDANTWRRLRKTDPQFLARLKASKRAPSPTPPHTLNSVPAETAGPPPAEAFSSTFTLSRERLRDYIAAFVLAGLDPQIGAELEFFGERVQYFDSGIVDRTKIRRDLQRYDQHWPERRFWLAGEIQIQPPQADGRLRVSFPLRYQLRNQSKSKSGKVQKTLVLEVDGEDLAIVGVNERKA